MKQIRAAQSVTTLEQANSALKVVELLFWRATLKVYRGIKVLRAPEKQKMKRLIASA